MFSFRSNVIPLATFVLITLLLSGWKSDSYSYNKTFEREKDSSGYLTLLEGIKKCNDSIAVIYKTASLESKQELNSKASEYLIKTWYKEIAPEWIGTSWEFYGKTEIPKRGSIACGYFVSTTLNHLGIKLDRISMAEGYSAWMVNSLCDTSFKFLKLSDFIELVKKKPDDIWIVGLSNHTGLLIKYKGAIRFVHSSYIDPVSVVDEPANSSIALKSSQIYVVGHLFNNNSLTTKWINKVPIMLVKKY